MTELAVTDLRYIAQQLQEGESNGDTYVRPDEALLWAADTIDALTAHRDLVYSDLLRCIIERDAALHRVAELEVEVSQTRFRELDLMNERLWLRANVYRMAMALLDIDDQAMTLLTGRTDAWPLIDAIERGHAAWLQLGDKYPEPYMDDDAMLRTAGCVLDVRPTVKHLACDHPEHTRAALEANDD